MKTLYLSSIATSLLFLTSCHSTSTKRIVSKSTHQAAVIKKADANPVQADTTQNDESADDYDAYLNIDNYKVGSAPENQTVEISQKVAILIDPNDEQIARLKKTMSEEDLSTVADDYSYYQYTTKEYLQKQPIQVVEPSARYARLKGTNQTYLLDLHPKASSGWVAIFFQPDSVPRIIDTTDPESAYKSYFGQPANTR